MFPNLVMIDISSLKDLSKHNQKFFNIEKRSYKHFSQILPRFDENFLSFCRIMHLSSYLFFEITTFVLNKAVKISVVRDDLNFKSFTPFNKDGKPALRESIKDTASIYAVN